MRSLNVEFVMSAFQAGQFPWLELPEVAFAGRSNVGKSSLINAVLNRKGVARVSGRPGRTQSINFFKVNERWVFVDLPGYGFAKVPKEVQDAWRPLIESYLMDRLPLQLVVLIVDIRRDPMASDVQLKQFLDGQQIPVVLVATKADKLSKQKGQRSIAKLARAMGMPPSGIVRFSAQSGDGRPELWKLIYESLEEGVASMKAARMAQELEDQQEIGASSSPDEGKGMPGNEGPPTIVTDEEGRF